MGEGKQLDWRVRVAERMRGGRKKVKEETKTKFHLKRVYEICHVLNLS